MSQGSLTIRGTKKPSKEWPCLSNMYKRFCDYIRNEIKGVKGLINKRFHKFETCPSVPLSSSLPLLLTQNCSPVRKEYIHHFLHTNTDIPTLKYVCFPLTKSCSTAYVRGGGVNFRRRDSKWWKSCSSRVSELSVSVGFVGGVALGLVKVGLTFLLGFPPPLGLTLPVGLTGLDSTRTVCT